MKYFQGSVKYQIVRSGETVDCHQTLNGQLIIDDDIEIIEREHPLRFILVVEKDTIFQVEKNKLREKQAIFVT